MVVARAVAIVATAVVVSCGGLPAAVRPSPATVTPAPVTVPSPAPKPPTSRPVQLLIPALRLSARVVAVGTDHGAMATPDNVSDVGWYRAGPVPGAAGDAVFDGHVGYPGQPLVFGQLGHLKVGDRLTVVRADHSKQTFTVTTVKVMPAAKLLPGTFDIEGPARITLITCHGSFDWMHMAYAERLYVVAQ